MAEPRPAGCTSPCIACMTDESHDPTPAPLSPCRRIDRHNSHVHEVYRRPFLCPGVTEIAEAEDQPTLRETIRLTIARQHLQDVGSDRTVEDLDDAEFADDADAVMAVLPAPVVQADQLRALHRDAYAGTAQAGASCSAGCGAWPCATIRILDEQPTPVAPADRAATCICGHPEPQHFEDVCQTCDCGDYIEPQDAREVIARWRQAATANRDVRRASILRAWDQAVRAATTELRNVADEVETGGTR